MPRVVFGAGALRDLERITDFLLDSGLPNAANALETILGALQMLARHPLIGRPMQGPLRELVISYGASGYVALYRFAVRHDRIDILAIRHPREAGFG